MSKGDLISRSALLKEYKKLWGNSFSAILDLIRNAPAADVVNVVHGEWEFRRMTGEKSYWASCSNCGGLIWLKDSGDEPDYCDNCGAKMDGGKTNE